MILLTFNIINNKRDFKNNYRLNDGEITEITIDNVSSVLRILGNNNILATFFIEIPLVVTLQPLIKKIIRMLLRMTLIKADIPHILKKTDCFFMKYRALHLREQW